MLTDIAMRAAKSIAAEVGPAVPWLGLLLYYEMLVGSALLLVSDQTEKGPSGPPEEASKV